MEHVVYELKPYLCFVGGVVTFLPLSVGSAFSLLLIFMGAVIWAMRHNYRRFGYRRG